TIQCRETPSDEEVVPARAVLVEQQDGLSRRAHARLRARPLDLHERDEAVDLRLLRSEFGKDTAEAERLFAERRPHPVVAGRSRVALVEDEVDHLQHRGQAGGKISTEGDLKGNERLAEGQIGPDDQLDTSTLRDVE